MEKETLLQDTDQPLQPTNEQHWCFAYYAGSENANEIERAALLNSTKWPGAKPQIKIAFLDGEPLVQEKVKKAAMGWTKPGMANVSFIFINNIQEADIRISFKFPGSWSALGTTCKQVPKDRPTMNYGWLNNKSTDDEINRVVLHEFGHALGLIHEHMNPADGGIKWNKEAVNKELSGPPNNWTKEQIENNMFKTFDKSQLKLTSLDKESIMMYPIPAKWTQDGFNVGLNTHLSPTDIAAIRKMYPGNNTL